MKTSLFAAAAALAVACASAPSFAADFYTPNGFAGFDYTYNHVDASGVGSADTNSYGVSGSTNVKLNSVLNLQLDADYAHTDTNGFSYDAGGGDAHLFARNETGAFGLVGGAHTVDSVTVGDFGAEGARFLGKWTVLGDVETHWSDISPRIHLTNIDLGARYYVTDNFRIDAGAGYDRPSVLGAYSNGWDLNLGGEYRLPKQPVSFYAQVQYTDYGHSFEVKDTAVHVGVRWNFDGSLKARERDGATFAGNSSVDRIPGLF